MWIVLLLLGSPRANAEDPAPASAPASTAGLPGPGAPPGGAPAPSAPPEPRPLSPAEAAALRNSLFIRPDPSIPGGWWVETGAHSGPISTLTFIRAVEAYDTQHRLEVERSRMTTGRVVAGVLGAGGVVGGLMLVGAAGPRVTVPVEPDPRDYVDDATYADAASLWLTRQDAADARDEAITNGLVLTTAGALCFAAIPLIGGDIAQELRFPGLALPLPAAREAVDRYNAQIRVRFGVVELSVVTP